MKIITFYIGKFLKEYYGVASFIFLIIGIFIPEDYWFPYFNTLENLGQIFFFFGMFIILHIIPGIMSTWWILEKYEWYD